jgi:ABC-type nitrate/sulfonate/bicarbonate transport system permease component
VVSSPKALTNEGEDARTGLATATASGAVVPSNRAFRWTRASAMRLSAAWPALLGLVVLIGVWQVVVVLLKVDPTVLPSPARVASQGWINRSALWQNTLPTIKETLIGITAALIVSAVLSAAIDLSKSARRIVYPLLVASQSIPVLVIAPLFVIWFGFGLLPKVLVVILVTFFPTTVALLEGFNSTEPEASNLIRSMGAGPFKEFWMLRVPTALPFFFAGLRVAVSFAVMAAIFGEWVGASVGLGVYMELEKNALRTDLVFAAVVVTAALSMILYGLTFLIQNATMPWYRQSRQTKKVK